ncbi:ankyrin repeat domain-containing protein [Paludisphaera soli]|uniref:ankyrin repeat domain-containing protein n=1 Tax=Paludisphaera soli TaxID=2712865 RepID=UPI0013EBBF2F|nr:ankyrin repeat domain-containing protein [Paludisphaera soli]
MQLPARPNLDQLRNQAKDLLKARASGEPDALKRFEEHSAEQTLSGAQFVIAREYGFAGWPALKTHVESLTPDDPEKLMRAIESDDVDGVRLMLKRSPSLRKRINDPLGSFDSPPLNSVQSAAMIDALVEAGADLNGKSAWWAGGFGVTHLTSPELAAYAVERGAELDIHAAARLGRLDRVRELIERNPDLVHARGGDGQTPLHFAKTVEITEYLLDHGADIDAKDVDHESTPAQYMLGDRPDVARYLVERGCKTDILMASAIGDLERVRAFLDADPASIRVRGNARFFPMANPHAGGTIYQWSLGSNASTYQAAEKYGHQDVIRLLLDRSSTVERLIALCWLHDATGVTDLLAANPGLAVSADDRSEVARAATRNDTEAVRLMLQAGLPVNARGQHGATPIHWAAFHGNLAMIQAILPFGPPLEDAENDYKSRPLGWATYGSEHGWYSGSGDYVGTVEALLAAGSKLPAKVSGSEVVQAVLRRHGATG